MEVRVGYAHRRCYEAMSETQDVEIRRSLWRAAVKYSRKDWDRPGLESPTGRSPRARHGEIGVGVGARID